MEVGIQIVKGDITQVVSGIIMQQVNCKGVMGAGVAKAIYDKWPNVKKEYLICCSNNKNLKNKMQLIKLSEQLYLINSFTQKNFGNSYKTGICYTDESALIKNIITICANNLDRLVYIPEKIGCGLVGGNWDYVLFEIEHLNNLVVVSNHK